MSTANHKNMNLKEEFVERTRPGYLYSFLIQLKTMLRFNTNRLFGPGSTWTSSPKLVPTPLILLGTSSPCWHKAAYFISPAAAASSLQKIFSRCCAACACGKKSRRGLRRRRSVISMPVWWHVVFESTKFVASYPLFHDKKNGFTTTQR